MPATLPNALPPELQRVFALYPQLERPHAFPIAAGLVNQSFLVFDGAPEAAESQAAQYVLQRVNPVFASGIHANIHVVTEHLAQKGLCTPRLLPTGDGHLYVDIKECGRWRLLTRVAGVSFDRVCSSEQARAAGALIARFHSALADLDAPLEPIGLALHDTAHHLSALAEALRAHADHPLHSDVSNLAKDIFDANQSRELLSQLPERIAHGDLKFNNLLFRSEDAPGNNEAIALIDLDTLSRLPLYVELGDAWRSWCNRKGEDAVEAELDLGIFKASLDGYLGALEFAIEAAERRSLALGIERISLELAARFAADALEESYFGWDAQRFARAGEHNLLRARCQWSLYQQAVATREERFALLLG